MNASRGHQARAPPPLCGSLGSPRRRIMLHHRASSCRALSPGCAHRPIGSTSSTSKHQTNCGGSLARPPEVEVRRRDRCRRHSRSLAPLLTCYRCAAPRLARRLVRASAIGRRPESRCDRLRCATSASARPTRPTTRYRAHDPHAWHRRRVGQQGLAAGRDRRDQVDFCSGALPVGAGRDVPRHAPPHVDAGAGRAMLLHCTVSLLLLLLLPIFRYPGDTRTDGSASSFYSTDRSVNQRVAGAGAAPRARAPSRPRSSYPRARRG